MQRAMSGQPREMAVFQSGEDGKTIIGRVAARGLADELYDKGYLVVDGIDGKAHYVALPPKSELEQYRIAGHAGDQSAFGVTGQAIHTSAATANHARPRGFAGIGTPSRCDRARP